MTDSVPLHHKLNKYLVAELQKGLNQGNTIDQLVEHFNKENGVQKEVLLAALKEMRPVPATPPAK
jgi:hypothetical protein